MTLANFAVAVTVPRLTKQLGNKRLLAGGLALTLIGMACEICGDGRPLWETAAGQASDITVAEIQDGAWISHGDECLGGLSSLAGVRARPASSAAIAPTVARAGHDGGRPTHSRASAVGAGLLVHERLQHRGAFDRTGGGRGARREDR